MLLFTMYGVTCLQGWPDWSVPGGPGTVGALLVGTSTYIGKHSCIFNKAMIQLPLIHLLLIRDCGVNQDRKLAVYDPTN